MLNYAVMHRRADKKPSGNKVNTLADETVDLTKVLGDTMKADTDFTNTVTTGMFEDLTEGVRKTVDCSAINVFDPIAKANEAVTGHLAAAIKSVSLGK